MYTNDYILNCNNPFRERDITILHRVKYITQVIFKTKNKFKSLPESHTLKHFRILKLFTFNLKELLKYFTLILYSLFGIKCSTVSLLGRTVSKSVKNIY